MKTRQIKKSDIGRHPGRPKTAEGPKKAFTCALHPDLIAWIKKYSKSSRISQNQLIALGIQLLRAQIIASEQKIK